MPYGLKRGVRAPGEFGISDIFGLALAGSAGIIAALITDYRQSGEASAIYTINQWVVWLGNFLGLGDIPLWMVVVGLITFGASSTFYFQPITRQGAFAQGFGLLAVIMTAVPADLAGGLEPSSNAGDLPGLQPAALVREASFSSDGAPSLYVQAVAQVVPVQAGRSGAKYNVAIEIKFPDGVPENIDSLIRRGWIRGRLHNENTNETFNVFKNAGGTLSKTSNSLMIRAGVPARSESAVLWVRVECSGYKIDESSREVRLGQAVNWSIPMQKSGTPLWIQRLGKSYWF